MGYPGINILLFSNKQYVYIKDIFSNFSPYNPVSGNKQNLLSYKLYS